MQTQNVNTPGVIIKYSIPNRYDLAPCGSLCKVVGDNAEEIYIQTSKDQDHANWQKIGTILEKVFKNHMLNPIFINECLEMYLAPVDADLRSSFTKLSNILANPPTS